MAEQYDLLASLLLFLGGGLLIVVAKHLNAIEIRLIPEFLFGYPLANVYFPTPQKLQEYLREPE